MRVHTEEALVGERWARLAATLRGEENEEGQYAGELWLAILLE